MTGLKKNEDFKRVYQAKRSHANRLLVLYIRENGLSVNRLGISVSKKVGNSVTRHRIKRLVKESFRLHEKEFRSGYDLVFVARKEAVEKSFGEMEQAMLQLMAVHRLLV